jgi:1-pyrroline-5-carboxylate dehydrogenase
LVNTTFRLDEPKNEPIRSYAPGSPEAVSLAQRVASLSKVTQEIPCIVGGERIETGELREWHAPHDQGNLLCRYHAATPEVVQRGLEAGRKAWQEWSETPAHVRASVLLKAADLLAGPWRDTINASTMLGQSKTCYQAEIDAACELADFWRFNCYYLLNKIQTDQPASPESMWNYVDYRPLEGFVYAVTPFNFTSIAGNLPTAPVLMGNVAFWKPSSSSVLSNYYLMELLEEAGLPPGVINFVPGNPRAITQEVLAQPDFAGLHYTGSTEVFQHLWKSVADNLPSYNTYPRLVGETGGKDFIFAHASADVERLVVAALRGAFEYQGQKCSAASRMYVPRSLWHAFRDRLIAQLETVRMGDVSDFSNFMGAVINENAFNTITGAIEGAKKSKDAEIVAGGKSWKQPGWFIEPTVIHCTDPRFDTMERELFGPVLSVFCYEDDKLDEALALCDSTSPYALTGAIFCRDRVVAEHMATSLRHAAGNFYINDKPTGAVVNQQPFGGARASGTDDKAGSPLNLVRWIAARTVKETWDAPTDYRYPHMGPRA